MAAEPEAAEAPETAAGTPATGAAATDAAATGPVRTCIASGRSGAPESMVRFVVGPDGEAVPDLARKLPGRGMWVTARRADVAAATARNLFSRAARRPVKADAALADRVEALLFERAVATIGLARRAGRAVAGFAKVEERVRDGRAGLVVVAGDAGDDGVRKLGAARQAVFADAATLGAVFGRDSAVYVAIERDGRGSGAPEGFARRVADAVARWAAYRGDAAPGTAIDGRD